jgi:DNA repair exonuclease SbcCD ATPase subunit
MIHTLLLRDILYKTAAVLILMVALAGCGADKQWVKDYVGQELKPLEEDRLKLLEASLTETRAEVELLHQQVVEIEGAEEETTDPLASITVVLEQALEENREELLWLREDVDEVDVRLAAVEDAMQIPTEDREVREAPQATAPGPALQPVPEETGPVGVEPLASQPVAVDLVTLAQEVEKLRAIIRDVSRLVEHVDRQYQQYHKEVGDLRVGLTNNIDMLEKGMGVLGDRMSVLEDTQRATLAEIAELPQKDVELLEERLRGLIKELPE